MKDAEWYVDWFNSPYYHLLYNNRSEGEAQLLIDHLCGVLQLPENSPVWDMACGKGRHAIALHKKGLNVTGSDLSANSIAQAKQHETAGLSFMVHDMLKPFKNEAFKLVCNLFTSFGYFPDEQDNLQVFRNAAQSLLPGGFFILDYFNSEKVAGADLSPYTEKRGALNFQIKKTIRNKCIVKRIEFTDQGHDYYFEESVNLLGLEDFIGYSHAAGLRLKNYYGSYQLETFDPLKSDRLILLFEKP
jgi:SAM-dependent methyltransferase